jgi:type VI secretion system protein ImpA
VPQGAKAEKAPEKAQKPEKPVTPVYEQPTASDDIRSFEMVESRQEVLELLDKICAYYEVFEPASPVPLLLKRAMRLVTMNFMEIIEELAPEGLSKVVMLCGPKEP